MPELPEVERGRKVAESVAAGRRIERVKCADDDIVIDGVTPRAMQRALKGRRVVAAHRWGKQIYFELDERPWPLFHFGMTGAFRTPGERPIQLESSPKVEPAGWPPRFTKIHMWFDDGGELVMTNPRRLGRIRLRRDPMNEPPISKLGFDPLHEIPTVRELAERLAKRRTPIKAVLLDQSFAAGVGNWIADEVLYQAGIDPRRHASSLDADELKRIRTKLRAIIRKAVEVNAEKPRYPRTWLFHHRWGKNSEARTSRGERIEHLTVGGRTTAWVPERQK